MWIGCGIEDHQFESLIKGAICAVDCMGASLKHVCYLQGFKKSIDVFGYVNLIGEPRMHF